MYNDIVRGDPHNERVCLANSTLWLNMQRSSLWGHWSFLGPRSETKCNATDTFRPGGEWDRVAEPMMINLSESGHPTFRATSALERGTLKSKGGGMLSINLCGDYVNVELIFRTFVPVNQLSIYGAAVAASCEEFTLPWANTRKPCLAMDKSESLVLFVDLLNIQSPLLTLIHKNGCSRTVFYDERCWRVLTIWWSSGMSRENFTSRRRIIKTKRMDAWRCKDWSSIGSGDQLPSRKARSWDWNWIFL